MPARRLTTLRFEKQSGRPSGLGPVCRLRARAAKGGMARLVAALGCLLALLEGTLAASCQDRDYLGTCTTDCDRYKFFVCSNVYKVGDYYHYVQQALRYPNLWLVLKDSRIDYYPAGSFADGNVTVLELRNARVNSFTQFETGPNPFLGAEQTLETIFFREDSTLPDSWQLLARLRKLAKLEFRDMAHLELTSDFDQLPATVERVYIYNSTIGYVHPRWLSQQKALKLVIIRDTNLNRFLRSMLPRPAPFLQELDLERNALTGLPLDIGEEMPLLEFLNVGRNNISTLDERSLAPLRRNTTYVYLFGNPLRCDCKLRFLVGYQESWTYSECAQPERLKGRYAGVLTAEEMTCEATDRQAT